MCSAASTYSDIQESKTPPNQGALASLSIWPSETFFLNQRRALIRKSRLSGRVPAPSSDDDSHVSIDLLSQLEADTYQLDVVSKTIARSQDRQSALCWLFGEVQFSLKCTSNGSLILSIHVMSHHIWLTQSGELEALLFCCLVKLWTSCQ